MQLRSLHPGSGRQAIELGFRGVVVEAAVKACLAAAAIDILEDRNEVPASDRAGYVEGWRLHGCFLAAEAIEAATSLAILICASRSRSWYRPAMKWKSVQLTNTDPSSSWVTSMRTGQS